MTKNKRKGRQPVGSQKIMDWTPRKSRWRAGKTIADIKSNRTLMRLAQRSGAISQVNLSNAHHFARHMDFSSELSDADKRGVVDNVHNTVIRFTPVEAELDELPLLQRLQRVKQLEALEHGYFAAATGHRYIHSVGTMHLAGRIAKALKLPKRQQQALRVAGLLHDVGHTAFSHGAEPLVKRKIGISHEELGERKMVDAGVPAILAKHGVDFQEVLRLKRGKGLGEIITEYADRLDYLQRDGMRVAKAETIWNIKMATERLIRQFRVKDGKLCVTPEGEADVKALADARSLFYSQVYFLPVSMVTRHLLRIALDQGLKKGAISMRDLLEKSDGGVMEKLAAGKIPAVRKLHTAGVQFHFNQVFAVRLSELSAGARENIGVIKTKLGALLRRARFAPHEFFVGVTPNVEKTVGYRVLKGDEIAVKHYSPTVPDQDKFLFVVVEKEKATKARQAIEKVARQLGGSTRELDVMDIKAKV